MKRTRYSMGHVEAERLMWQSYETMHKLYRKADQMLVDCDAIADIERIHRAAYRSLKRFMRRAALVRKLQNIEIGDLR